MQIWINAYRGSVPLACHQIETRNPLSLSTAGAYYAACCPSDRRELATADGVMIQMSEGEPAERLTDAVGERWLNCWRRWCRDGMGMIKYGDVA